MKINKVAIFGGNGTVGSLVGGILAGLGDLKVYLISRDKRKLNEQLLEKIYKSIKSDIISENIVLCNYDEAKEILPECDWIFESVAEDYKIKDSINKIIDQYSKKDAIITTGTSGLSVNKLSETFGEDKRKNFFGTHFFNPPYHMTLCELITTEDTDMEKVEFLREFLEKKILRTIVVSKDNPAFIANRIGFKLMNDLILLSEKYQDKGGIDYIDSLFSGYTGRNMSPISTIDFVGLDIHKAIVDNIYNQTEDEFKSNFKLPEWFNDLVKNDFLGNKSKQGLYKNDENKLYWNIDKKDYELRKEYKFDYIEKIKKEIAKGNYIEAYKELFDDSTEEKNIVAKVLTEYIVYSIYISNLTAEKIDSCDDAMASGFGWCPPIALKELIEKVCDFEKICTKYIGDTIMNKYNLYQLIKDLPKSKYDYRKYIKAI